MRVLASPAGARSAPGAALSDGLGAVPALPTERLDRADGSELAGASPTVFTLERADVGAVGSTFSGGML